MSSLRSNTPDPDDPGENNLGMAEDIQDYPSEISNGFSRWWRLDWVGSQLIFSLTIKEFKCAKEKTSLKIL